MRPEIRILLALAGFGVLSMIVYAFSAESRAPGKNKSGRAGSFLLGFWLRDWFYWLFRPFRDFCASRRISPTTFNVLGVIFGAIAMVLFARGQLAAAGYAILLSGIADALDGEVARAQGRTSRAGAFIDSTLDRWVDFMLFAGLAVFFDSGLPVLLCLVGLGGSLLVSYTRARGEALGVSCRFGVMQRAERMIGLAAGGIFDATVASFTGAEPGTLMIVALALIAAGSTLTALYRTIWIARSLHQSD